MTRRELACRLAAIGLVGPLLARPNSSQFLGVAAAEPIQAWPDSTNTGVPDGTTLTPHDGNLRITAPATTIRGLDIKGTVTVDAPGVTLEKCRVTATHSWDWYVILAAGDTVIQDCTVDGGNVNEGQNAINGGGRFLRNNIFNTENGIAPGSNTLIQDNYIHDLKAPGSPHYDGIQIDGGQSNVTIRHNTIINPWTQTSAVMIDNWAGPIFNVNVDDNVLVGGGYTIYVDGRFNNNPISSVSITNNHFGGARWGMTHFNRSSPVFAGNTGDGLAIARVLNLPR
jgi:hypothetical protein